MALEINARFAFNHYRVIVRILDPAPCTLFDTVYTSNQNDRFSYVHNFLLTLSSFPRRTWDPYAQARNPDASREGLQSVLLYLWECLLI
jgi:hypothetical protein